MGDFLDVFYMDHARFSGENDDSPKSNNGYGEFVVCKYCRQGFKSWAKVEGRWRLLNLDETIHSCEEFKSASKEVA